MQDFSTREHQWITGQAQQKTSSGQTRLICPWCSPSRTKKREPCLSVEVKQDGVAYNCWHCDAEGFIPDNPREPRQIKVKPRPVIVAGELTATAIAFLEHRGIPRQDARDLGLFSGLRYSRKAQKEVETIAFAYRDGDDVYAVKHRCIEPKDFSWEGQPRSLWNIHRAEPGVAIPIPVDGIPMPWDRSAEAPLIITEGEIDTASLAVAGVLFAVSAPNGAPQKVKEGKIDPKDDKSFNYVWEARETIEKFKKIILCVDNDGPGLALAEELARRIGRAKCWQVTYPDDCKDINDVLVKYGKEEVREVIKKAKPWPVAGLYPVEHYRDKIGELYQRGPGSGESTGYPDVDEIYTVVPGQVTIITGIPGSGKSELIDQIMFNLARDLDWKHCVCSFENPPEYHIPKIAEKFTNRPFFTGAYPRMSDEERDQALDWIDEHYVFMDQSDGEPCTIDAILERATAAVQRLGVRGLVVDPYNYIDMGRDDTETNEVSRMLTKVRRFAKATDVHVWFIAHPLKLRSADGSGIPIPKGYEISGSAAWFSKADVGLTILRPWMHSPIVSDEIGNKNHAMPMDNKTEVLSWKIRFKWVGTLGSAQLEYNPVNGVYGNVVDWNQEGVNIANLPWYMEN